MSHKGEVGVMTGPVVDLRADVWTRDTHLRYQAVRATMARTGPAVTMAGEAKNAEVWTNLANAFALQATDRAAASAPATKKGFDAFPVTTQQMILFSSERTAEGFERDAPVDTYTEVLILLNAAYMAQHLHHHLKTRLGLDILLPSGFCSAIRMASFAHSLSDRSEAFSLFACGPQPLANRAGATTDNDTADKHMRMQLKVADSTTGLSDFMSNA